MSTSHPGSAFAFAPAPGLAGIDEPVDVDTLSSAQKAGLMDRIYERGDRLVTRFVCLHALFALCLAFFYQTWLVTGVVTFCAVTLFAVSARLLPRSFLTRCLAGVSLQIFVALHIYQLHGLAEMHFFFFTAFTMLIVYQDWKCMWPGALGLIGQHLGFALLHNAGIGAGLLFFDVGYVGVTKLFFHFSIALSQVALCGYWAFLLKRQTLASAAQNAGLRALGERLHRSEGKFRALIAHALDIITILDADGTIRYESPAVARVLGYRPDELVGRNVLDLIHPDDRDATRAAFARGHASASPEGTPTEFRLRHRDGSWHTIEAVGSTMDAVVGGIVVNSRDVTARRRAEREASRRASQQNATSELAREALAGQELAGLLASAVRLVARTLEVEFCYVGERTGDDQHLVVRAGFGYPPGDGGETLIPVGPRSQGGYTLLVREPVVVDDLPTETRFEPSGLARELGVRSGLSVIIDGRERVYGVLVTQSVEPRRFSAGDIAFLSAVADILSATLERRQADQAIRAARDEAERANHAKSEFLSRMSHELRTPLNAILGFSQLLETGKLPARELESVSHILKAGRHLLGLIDEVLAISRIEAGKMRLEPEPVAVGEMVGECLNFVGGQAEARRVSCRNGCTAPGGDAWRVSADRQRLRQVLLNLLSNAIKYNREGGWVSVDCRPLPAAPPGEGARLRLEVTDTGLGLGAADIAHLFTPFERLGAERSATEGTGLGLTVSKGLVEAMDGRIGVDSVPGQGSTFWLELPLAKHPLARFEDGPEPAFPVPPRRPHVATILYIEDNPSNLRLVEMVLEGRPDLLLLSATQGRLGVDLARARHPDVVLLDLHLPDLPGWDVLALLQGDARTHDIPVVVISADATPGQIARLLEAGACEYLTKPLDVGKLLQTLDEHLGPRGAALAMAT